MTMAERISATAGTEPGRGWDAISPEDMARVNEDDFRSLQDLAQRYCRVVDSTRSRKRMDGSATVAPGGRARYGTDDVSADVTQDAVLIFAKRLAKIIDTCEPAALWTATRAVSAWQYERRDGWVIVVTRTTLQRWAVRDAAARNGYRLDVAPEEIDTMPGAQLMRGVPHADTLTSLAVTPYVSGQSESIFRAAWGDGSEYPTLGVMLRFAGNADDLGRAGVISRTAQELRGGRRDSRYKVRRTRDDARREWKELRAALDSVRDDMIYESARRR
ncbi:hypothetical protein FH609_002525 [Streptomyces sp. 3MP-14]|uniref:Uncharacterized protein n=1 Tax=Streptomyces mimosae TaxID=2586635 RepID=A0A5N6AFV1_9ACTN|nr:MULTISPECIES: hypothetical protein [Streptomyces]KAB8166438.1 hypothetical protein FH607_011475 [Streptomyces mimosae]KAB8178867.1 hypothetical protein FH609_002525 [Streptomyces sp. 3MP-14]